MRVSIPEDFKGPSAIITGIGLTITALVAAALVLFIGRGFADSVSGLLVAIGILLISIPVLKREAKRQEDPLLFTLLVAGLLLRFAGVIARSYVSLQTYGGTGDALQYHAAGAEIAERFRDGVFTTGLPYLTGTNFIKVLTGGVYTAIGPTRLGGYFVFAWLAFWGLFFFYRAFRIAVPDGQRRLYAGLIFFLPSLVFWPSSIGKESWLILTLGLAAWGAALIFTGSLLRGFIFAGLGLWLMSFVRPHVAGMFAIAVVAAAVVARSRSPNSRYPILKRCVALVILIPLSLVLVRRTSEYFSDVSVPSNGYVSTLTELQRRTTNGGSTFSATILDSPSRAPTAAITVLFRPLIIDAHNAQAMISASEGTFLLLLVIVRFRSVLAAIRSGRRRPYVLMALVFTALFIVAFSGVANFGLLARERVQVLPLFFVLLAIPHMSRRAIDRPRPGDASMAQPT